MSKAHVRGRFVGLDTERALLVTKFPLAPLVRLQVVPHGRDGVVLDIYELRELRDSLDGIITEIEEGP